MDQGAGEQARTPGPVKYQLTLTVDEASAGVTRVLTRNTKKLEVRIPPGTRDNQVVRLTNALRVTDGQAGDILIQIHVAARSASEGVRAVTDATFEAEVLKSQLPVLVDFWAPWCGPCRALAPVTEQMAQEFSERLKVCKLNVDENPLASRKYQVASVPTMIFFKRGMIADVSVGALSAPEMRRKIDAVLSSN